MLSQTPYFDSSTSIDAYKTTLLRPDKVEFPIQCTSNQLWCGSISEMSTDSGTGESPPQDTFLPFLNAEPQKQTANVASHEVLPEILPPKKIRNVRKSNKYHCVVCGDKPTGYHYDVLSCNGCKTFFRRTIISNRQFKCAKGGKCQFSKDFRCACRACRFAKCVSVGMNKKGIQFPSPNSNSEAPYEESDPGQGTSNEYTVSEAGPSQKVPAMLELNNCEDTKFIRALSTISYREESTKALRSMNYPIVPLGSLKTILREPCLVGRNLFDSKDYLFTQQREYEKNPVRFWMIADLYLTVEYAKTFDVFRKLSEDDQQRLLISVCGIVQTASQAFYSAEQKSESITFPDGLNALQIRLQTRPDFEQYYREAYCRPVGLIRQLELSRQAFVLFKTLALFSSDTSELSAFGRQTVNETREKLIHYLRKLLIKEHGLAKGTERLAMAILSLSSFVAVQEKKRNYLEVCDLLSKIDLSPLAKSVFLKRLE